MNDAKYIGMDVHQATISVAVRDSRGNLVMEAILDRRTQAVRASVSEQAQPGVPRRTWYAYTEGTGTQLPHDHS